VRLEPGEKRLVGTGRGSDVGTKTKQPRGNSLGSCGKENKGFLFTQKVKKLNGGPEKRPEKKLAEKERGGSWHEQKKNKKPFEKKKNRAWGKWSTQSCRGK